MIPVPSPHSFSCYIHDISMANLTVHRQEPVPSTACRALITWLLWRRWPYVWALRPIQRFSAMLGGSTSIDALWNTPLLLRPLCPLCSLCVFETENFSEALLDLEKLSAQVPTCAKVCKGVQREGMNWHMIRMCNVYLMFQFLDPEPSFATGAFWGFGHVLGQVILGILGCISFTPSFLLEKCWHWLSNFSSWSFQDNLPAPQSVRSSPLLWKHWSQLHSTCGAICFCCCGHHPHDGLHWVAVS